MNNIQHVLKYNIIIAFNKIARASPKNKTTRKKKFQAQEENNEIKIIQ